MPETLVATPPAVGVPTRWRNLVADFPHYAQMKLPDAVKASMPDKYAYLPKMPLAIGRQSVDTRNPYIEIPEEIRELYRLYRPTPLRRAKNFERAIGTDCRIYFKFEGANISGSHKLNSAIAQAYYYKKAGVKHVVTGTGAGQWGTALAYACNHFGLECTIFMPKVSLEQKPQRRVMMEIFGAKLYKSPSDQTELGRRTRAENPDKLGTLAVATGEALEMSATADRTQFAVGSGENHVLLHQTVIGEEALEQMEQIGDWPDLIYACMGAGSNFAGVTFPFIGAGPDRPRPRCVAVEPAGCPKLTRGVYAYTETDFSGTTPIAKMMTLGSDFEAPGIHAGGLRYHGTSPFLSAMFTDGIFEGVACPQNAVFEAAVSFARTEGFLPAPESSHALCAAADEARRLTERGEKKVILVNISGMGFHDTSGYDEYMRGTLDDGVPKDEAVERSLNILAQEQGRYL